MALPPVSGRVVCSWETLEADFHSFFLRHNLCTLLAMLFLTQKEQTEGKIWSSPKSSWCVWFTHGCVFQEM